MTLMDRSAPDAVLVPAPTALAAAEDLIQRWHEHDDGRLRYCVTPRFAPSCTSQLMKGAAALAQRHDLWIQTHVAESRAELAAVAARFPDARDYLEVYADHGLVGDKTLLAHCVWFDDVAWDAAASAGCAVSHCPDSNFFLGSGQMPLAAPLSRGIRVGLGTDVGAGRSFSLRRIVASAYDTGLLTGAEVRAESLLWLATTGGARALGVGDTVGRLAAGYEADLVAVDLLESDPRNGDGLFEALAFRNDAGPVAATYVRGRRVSS
jgi:guanine deaminase